jgi:hypothetical protein
MEVVGSSEVVAAKQDVLASDEVFVILTSIRTSDLLYRSVWCYGVFLLLPH